MVQYKGKEHGFFLEGATAGGNHLVRQQESTNHRRVNFQVIKQETWLVTKYEFSQFWPREGVCTWLPREITTHMRK